MLPALILAIIAGKVSKVQKCIENIDKKKIQAIKWCKENKKTVGMHILKFIIIIALLILCVYMYSRSGKLILLVIADIFASFIFDTPSTKTCTL